MKSTNTTSMMMIDQLFNSARSNNNQSSTRRRKSTVVRMRGISVGRSSKQRQQRLLALPEMNNFFVFSFGPNADTGANISKQVWPDGCVEYINSANGQSTYCFNKSDNENDRSSLTTNKNENMYATRTRASASGSSSGDEVIKANDEKDDLQKRLDAIAREFRTNRQQQQRQQSTTINDNINDDDDDDGGSTLEDRLSKIVSDFKQVAENERAKREKEFKAKEANERHTRNLKTNEAIKATARAAFVASTTIASDIQKEQQMQKQREEEEEEEEANVMSKSNNVKEDDVSARLDAIVAEFRKKKEEAAALTNVTSYSTSSENEVKEEIEEEDVSARLDAIVAEFRKKKEEAAALTNVTSYSTSSENEVKEEIEEEDVSARLDAIVAEFRKKKGTMSSPNLAIQGKNGGMSGMASFYSSAGYAGFSWIGEEDVEMEDDHDHDHQEDEENNHVEETRGAHSGRVGKTSFYSSAGYASFAYAVDAVWDVLVVPSSNKTTSKNNEQQQQEEEEEEEKDSSISNVWGQTIGKGNTIVSTSGIAYQAKPSTLQQQQQTTKTSSSIIAESMSRDQAKTIRNAWKRVDARFDLPGPPNMWSSMDMEEKFLAVALSMATSILVYQTVSPVLKNPVQTAAASSIKKLAHISSFNRKEPAMPLTRKEKAALEKKKRQQEKMNKNNIKNKNSSSSKTASINQSIGEIALSKKKAASMLPGDDVAPGEFLAIIREDGTIDYTLRNVCFLIVFSFIARVVLRQYPGMLAASFAAITASPRSLTRKLINTGFKDEEKIALDKEAIRMAAEIKAKRKEEEEVRRKEAAAKWKAEKDIAAVVDAKLAAIRAENDILLNKVSKFFENEEIEMVAQLMKENDAKIEAVLAQLKYAKAERNSFKRLMENEMMKAQSMPSLSLTSSSLPLFETSSSNLNDVEMKRIYEAKISEIQKDAETARKAFAFFKKEYIAKEASIKKTFAEKEQKTAIDVKQKIDDLLLELIQSQEEFEKVKKDAEIALKLALENNYESEKIQSMEIELQKAKEDLVKEQETNRIFLQKTKEDIERANELKILAVEQKFKAQEDMIKKDFEKRNVQTFAEMKKQSNKEINSALADAKERFEKEKLLVYKSFEEERLQQRLSIERERERLNDELKQRELKMRKKSDELIDEIALEFRREIEGRNTNKKATATATTTATTTDAAESNKKK
jgi:hypothetical protein